MKTKADAATRRHGDAERTAGSGWRTAKEKFAAANRFSIAAVFLALLLNFGCTPRSFDKPNVAAPPASENKQSQFEADLQTMKTAGFEYIFVFRRKDGGAFDAGDRKYLRTNSPAETNRFVSTDDDRAFIAGSKYLFSPQSLEFLRMRFNVEDYSTPKEVK